MGSGMGVLETKRTSQNKLRGDAIHVRRLLLVRDLSSAELADVVKVAVETEAARCRKIEALQDTKGVSDSHIVPNVVVEKKKKKKKGQNENGNTSSEMMVVRAVHMSSIETALSQICGPRLSSSSSGSSSGRGVNANAAHRTKEDLLALVQDKHKRALVSQVVSPADIGVNYDMIGGLSEVKELLRQSITYPLEFRKSFGTRCQSHGGGP